MHEKGLQKQKGDGPWVSSQKRRAAFSTRINHGYTGCQARTLFLHRFTYRISFVRASEETFRTFGLFSMPWRSWRAQGTVVPRANRPVGVPSCPAPLCPAALAYAAAFRPARGMPGFWIRQVKTSWIPLSGFGHRLVTLSSIELWHTVVMVVGLKERY